jgi:hypothetical protein
MGIFLVGVRGGEGARMRKLLATTAVLESGTGLGILALPSAVASLMLGSPLDTPAAVAVARIAGVALLALGVACWLACQDGLSRSARGLVGAMVLYNAGVIAVLVHEAVGVAKAGVALWPTVVAHAVMGVWCITRLRGTHP